MDKITIAGFRLKTLLLLISIFIFIAFFTIGLLLYAQGKRFKEGDLVDTGTIRLHTIPEKVDAYVDNTKISVGNDLIEGIVPGKVELKLSKDGYSDWTKTIYVDSNVVKDVYAQLFPENLNSEQITNMNVDNLAFSEDPTEVFYTIINSENESDLGLWKVKLSKSTLDFSSSDPAKIADFTTKILNVLENNEYSLTVAPDNNKILLTVPGEKLIYVYDANKTGEVLDLASEIGFYPDNVMWFKSSDALILQKGNIIFEYDVGSKVTTLVDYSSIDSPSFSISADSVYYYDLSKNLLKEYRNKVSKEILIGKGLELEIPENIRNIFSVNGNEKAIVIESDDGLYYLDFEKNYIDLISKDAKFYSMSSNGLNVIFEKDDAYSVYLLEETFDGRSYNSQIKKVNIAKNNLDVMYYSANSTNLIAFTKSGTELSLWVMDYDGQNMQLIDTGNSIGGDVAQIAYNGAEMYLFLEDGSHTDRSLSTKNLYKISLEVK